MIDDDDKFIFTISLLRDGRKVAHQDSPPVNCRQLDGGHVFCQWADDLPGSPRYRAILEVNLDTTETEGNTHNGRQ